MRCDVKTKRSAKDYSYSKTYGVTLLRRFSNLRPTVLMLCSHLEPRPSNYAGSLFSVVRCVILSTPRTTISYIYLLHFGFSKFPVFSFFNLSPFLGIYLRVQENYNVSGWKTVLRFSFIGFLNLKNLNLGFGFWQVHLFSNSSRYLILQAISTKRARCRFKFRLLL